MLDTIIVLVYMAKRRDISVGGEMTDKSRTKEQLVGELARLRQRNAELEAAEAERKLAEEALRDSQEFSSSLLDSSPNPILVINPDTSIRYVNPALERLTGFTSAELIGMKAPHPWWTEETKVKIREDLEKVMRRDKHKLEEVFRKKNGERFWVEITSKAIKREGKLEYHLSNWVDITERKQLEERYRALFEQALDGVFIIDENMRILMANQAAASIGGFDSMGELLGMNLLDFIHPEGRERTLRVISEDMFKNDLRQVNEFRCMKKAGEEIWVSAVGTLIEYEGKMAGLVSFRDITDRKGAEQALRESEEKFRTFMETASDLMHITDKDQNITYVNESMSRTLGYSRKEMIGMHITQLMSEQFLKGFEHRAEKLIRQGQLTQEPVWVTKEGEKAYCETKVVAVYDDDGKYTGSRGISRDVTERKKMEEELKLKATLLDNVQDAVNLSDIDGNIIYVNETACTSLGYSREELLKVNLGELDTAEYAHTLKWRNQELTKKKHTTFETANFRKDRSMIPVEVHARLIEVGGKKLVLSIDRDITERKRMEEERKEMEQKAHQESRLASIGEMASGVAHEINNPLVGVVGFAQLLMERKDLPDDVRGQLKMIHDGGQRVASIVKRLLSFTRQRKPERTYVDINQIIEATLEMRAYEMGTASIKVVTQFDSGLPWTMADAGQLQQVFLNLVINAEKEMSLAHGKGNLHIKTETIGNKIRISFKDDGPGIAKENLDRIFDPFFTTREVGQGTGLGLSVCHGIIAEHNGRIYAESKPGRGATFIVELPVISEDRQAKKAEPVTEEPGKVAEARILVVDDEPTNRQYLSEVFTGEGHEVETVDNGGDALKMIEKGSYDLILADIKMPGMNGVELYQRIQKTVPSLAGRVVFITGDVMGENTMKFLSSTEAPYVTKPFDSKKLKGTINRLLAS